MTVCKFSLPTGEQCSETQVDEDGFCKWHGKIPGVSDQLKEELQKKVKAGESLAGFNLKGADLHNIYLIRADLRHADLRHANLTQAYMYGADLEGADLFKSNLDKANLKADNLKNTILLAANFDNTKLEDIRWNKDFVIINERNAGLAWKKGDKKLALDKYKEAEEIYRSIKLAHRQLGHSKDQSPFFLREMIVHRKQTPIYSMRRFGSKAMDVTTGYGEKPLNVLWTSFAMVFYMPFFTVCSALMITARFFRFGNMKVLCFLP